jgi:hypothetical protein
MVSPKSSLSVFVVLRPASMETSKEGRMRHAQRNDGRNVARDGSYDGRPNAKGICFVRCSAPAFYRRIPSIHPRIAT